MQNLKLFYHLLVWFVVRLLGQYRWRVLTVLLGIGLGAAVFTSVRLSINASIDSFSKSMDLVAGKTDWVVVRPGGRVPEGLIAELAQIPEVRTASPFLSTYVRPEGEETEPFLLLGLDPVSDRLLRDWQIEESGPESSSAGERWLDLMEQPATLVLGERVAKRNGLEPGDTVALEHVQRRGPFRVLGVLASEGLAMVEGGNVAVTDIATIQEFMGLEGVVDRIDILLSSGARREDVERIRALLPVGVELAKPAEAKQSGRMMIRAYQLNLSVLSFVSLFVGMFLVYSLVALNARSRRHELAILRSVGASSRLVFLLFISEGMLFGVVGWLLALPLSTILVRYLLEGVSKTISNLFVRVQVDSLQLDPWEIILSFGITLLVSVAAAYQPAREAMRVSPREAMASVDSNSGIRKSPRSLAVTGVFLILAVWPLSRMPGAPGLPLPGYVATFLLFSGFSLLSPWCLQLIGTHLPPLLRRIQGEPAYLAGRYVRDAGTRTAISVGALITAMALYVALVIMVHSFRNTVEIWTEQSISGDIFIAAGLAEINQYRDALPDPVVAEIQNLGPEVDILPFRRIKLDYGNAPYQIDALDFDVFTRYGSLLFVKGDASKVVPRLEAGEGVVVSEVFASKTGLGVGDRYRARVGGAMLDLPILGIVRDYRTHGGVVLFSLRHFQEWTGDRAWTGARIYLRDRGQANLDGAVQRLRDEIVRQFGERYALGVIAGSELRRSILRIFDETFAITTVLLLIALVVAALGITTTLTVLVLERRRQLNTLLAVGAALKQIRRMICWEAVLMVSVGECVGLACGFILSYILIYVINRQSFGWTFLYVVDWTSLLGSLPLILLTALGAALPAIRLVFRYSPAMALRE